VRAGGFDLSATAGRQSHGIASPSRSGVAAFVWPATGVLTARIPPNASEASDRRFKVLSVSRSKTRAGSLTPVHAVVPELARDQVPGLAERPQRFARRGVRRGARFANGV
jgi:hypothetical protein